MLILRPNKYMTLLICLADIGRLQICRYWCTCFLQCNNIKFVLKEYIVLINRKVMGRYCSNQKELRVLFERGGQLLILLFKGRVFLGSRGSGRKKARFG